MKINLVVIDDDATLRRDPFFLVEIKECFSDIDVVFFEDSGNAISFIIEKMAVSEKTVILLDLGFPGNSLQGTGILKIIREKSLIIPVIIYTASNDDLIIAQELINLKTTAFIRKSFSTADKLKILKNVVDFLDIDIAGAIEEWIKSNSEERRNIQFITTSDGKTFTLNDLLNDIRKETLTGKRFANNLLKLTVDLISRNREKLND
ncbi:MAG: response regulator [Treponema sp.]|jgi:FixJ family two-component response regulator|nr:response regulator [Treponema sp.]